MSDLYKSSDVVLMNSKYYISFTESKPEAISLNSFEEHQLNDSDDNESYQIADQIIRNAEQEAAKILSEAKIQADNLLKQAKTQKEEQFSNGFTQGIEEAKKQYAEQLNNLNEALNNTLTEKKEIIDNTESQLIDLAVNIAQKILHEKISLSEENIKKYFENAIEDILRNDFEVICVRLNKYNIEKFYPDWEVEKYMLNIKHDARLDNSSCIVETETGDIDISVFTQLNEVSRKLVNVK